VELVLYLKQIVELVLGTDLGVETLFGQFYFPVQIGAVGSMDTGAEAGAVLYFGQLNDT
jgi:hypothetical protein